jgi:hypothetical protein
LLNGCSITPAGRRDDLMIVGGSFIGSAYMKSLPIVFQLSAEPS